MRNDFPLMLSQHGMTFPLFWANAEWLSSYAKPTQNDFPLTLSPREWLSLMRSQRGPILSQRGMTFPLGLANAEWLYLTLSQRGMIFPYAELTQNDFPYAEPMQNVFPPVLPELGVVSSPRAV